MTENITKKRGAARIFAAWLLLVCMIISFAVPIAADYPKKDGNVADEAGVLSETTIRSLKKKNDTLKADLGVSIALCTVKTTGDMSIDEYARGLFKSWNLGDGVLILIAVEDEDYYFIQSAGIEKIITNDVLAEVRDNYLEEDFSAGDIDRAVIKTLSNLETVLVSRLKESADAASAETAEEEKSEEEKNEGTTIGSFLVGLFKFILVLALIAILAFAALFIAAMFNDDCAELMRTYVFRRGQNKTPSYNYDERLYGRENRQPQSRRADPYAQNRQILDQRRSNPSYNPHRTNYGGQLDPNARRQPPQQPSYAQQQNYARRDPRYGAQRNPNYPQNTAYQQNGGYRNGALPPRTRDTYQNNSYSGANGAYYNADGTQRQRPQQRPAQYNQQGYPRQQRNSQYAEPAMNGDETRAFTIPGRGSN